MKTIFKILITAIFIVLYSCSDENETNNTVIDTDGNVYRTVKIGSQVWMAENLKTTTYNDGTSIPNVTDETMWWDLTTGAYCYYMNNANTYSNLYGCLYNWYVVNTGKLAPKGWHVPTDTEWQTLVDYLSNNGDIYAKSGFSALLGGYRLPGGFYGEGNQGNWWSSTKDGNSSARAKDLIYGQTNLGRGSSYVSYGYSVRCIKDN